MQGAAKRAISPGTAFRSWLGAKKYMRLKKLRRIEVAAVSVNYTGFGLPRQPFSVHPANCQSITARLLAAIHLYAVCAQIANCCSPLRHVY